MARAMTHPPTSDDPGALASNYSIEAEAALLGAMMIDNRMAEMTAAIVTVEDFFEPLHARIYEAIMRRVRRSLVADPVTLRPVFEADEAMRTLGGPAYLAQLTGNSAAIIGAMDFARQVADLAKRRRLVAALLKGVASLTDCSRDVFETDDIVAEIDSSLSIAVRADEPSKSLTMARAWDDALTYVDEIASSGAEPGLVIRNLPDWNRLLGNMAEGDLIVVAGRPGMGKTALACTVARGAAAAGHGTYFVSLEMPVRQLSLRMITETCFEYGQSFTFRELRRGRLGPYQRQKAQQARDQIADMPLLFREPGPTRIGQLLMDIRRVKRRMDAKGTPLKIVVVDYLQLLRGDKDRDNLVREIGEITRDLKLAAVELGLTIILLSQLSRAVEQREDKRPRLSDLRDSGSIEQDADAVIFLYREEYYLKSSEPPAGDFQKHDKWRAAMDEVVDRVELIAAKVRNDETSTANCYFYGAHQAIRGSKFHSEATS